MIFMIHRKPGFLNVKFVDKDFLCLKFSVANGIFRVNGKDWFLDFQIHHYIHSFRFAQAQNVMKMFP